MLPFWSPMLRGELMKYLRLAVCFLLLSLSVTAAFSQGNLLPLPTDQPAFGLRYPSLSPDGSKICFSYIGDLWTVPSTGGVATRLTINPALDGYPRWSPDGKWIAFVSSREGSYDIFLIPSDGGEARRLTQNSMGSFLNDWSPDGSKIIFTSARDTSVLQQYEIDVKTLIVKTLTHDSMFTRYGVYSPDGKSIAYDRSGVTAVWWRPRYHGSANFDIYTESLVTGKIQRITTYDGNDIWPMYSADGKSIYYVSDQLTPGSPNLVYIKIGESKPHILTHQQGDAIRYPCMSRNGKLIVYELGGNLYTVSSAGGASFKVPVIVRSDDQQNNIVHLDLNNGATEAEVSPDGKSLAIDVRGDIWTVPSEKGGEATRLTTNPANDFDFMWSPDSTHLAFVSDRKGNFGIYTIDAKTKEEKVISEDQNDENMPHWSPDGKSIAFLRSGPQAGLYVAAADGKTQPHQVAPSDGNNLFNVGITDYSWSPDSKWLAFSRRDPTNTWDVWVVPAAGGEEHNVTWYPGENVQPEWSSDGKYLVFLSSRDGQDDVYALPLKKEKADDKTDKTEKAQAAKQPVTVSIDFEDIENRAKRLTTQGVNSFELTPDGTTVVYIAALDYWSVPIAGGTSARITSSKEGTGDPRFSTDSAKFWALGNGGTLKMVTRAGGAVTQIPFDASMFKDLREERKETFNEFWRLIKVGFYDPTMHGVDWNAMRKRYEPMLPSIATPEEFANLLSEMIGELNGSHSEVGPAPGPVFPQTAELGLSFDETYAGPGLKVTGYMPNGPDDDLGPKIKAGEYVMQINGTDVSWNEMMYRTLLDQAGKTVHLLVNSKPDVKGARTVDIKAITRAQWSDLDYERKVKKARAEVEKLSNGKLAYIHIRAMDQPSLKKMERELWGKALEKDGLVLDIRENGGGNTHDEILSQLSRAAYAITKPRDGAPSTQPYQHWGKPIVLLIDQNSASDAEVFPDGFRQLKLGKIVGMHTPGYVIGTYDGKLQDGTSFRVPMWGWYTLSGKDLENRGVRPDVEVDPTPEDIAQHRDFQL
jgi:tricorn protease